MCIGVSVFVINDPMCSVSSKNTHIEIVSPVRLQVMTEYSQPLQDFHKDHSDHMLEILLWCNSCPAVRHSIVYATSNNVISHYVVLQ